MALPKIKRQIRSGKTQLTNITNELSVKEYALPDPQTPVTMRQLLHSVLAEGAKAQRAREVLLTWRLNYANFVNELADAQYNETLAEF